MANILDEIAEAARIRVAERKKEMSIERLEALLEFMPIPARGCPPGTGAYQTFQDALRKKGLSVIAEVKKASPSKGVISEDFPYLDIAYDYECGDADALSCLTEPHWFYGSDEVFTDIRPEVSMPMLRKDFVVDPYQIYEAKNLGADAVLLICSILDDEQLRECLKVCNRLYIDALVETHNEEEVRRAVDSNALIIGVNNRDLTDFSVDISNAAKLRELVPDDCIFIAESGIASVEDAKRAREAGADAILVGEYLMRANTSDERQALLRELTEIE